MVKTHAPTATDALIAQSREAIGMLEELVATLKGTLDQCYDDNEQPEIRKTQ